MQVNENLLFCVALSETQHYSSATTQLHLLHGFSFSHPCPLAPPPSSCLSVSPPKQTSPAWRAYSRTLVRLVDRESDLCPRGGRIDPWLPDGRGEGGCSDWTELSRPHPPNPPSAPRTHSNGRPLLMWIGVKGGIISEELASLREMFPLHLQGIHLSKKHIPHSYHDCKCHKSLLQFRNLGGDSHTDHSRSGSRFW